MIKKKKKIEVNSKRSISLYNGHQLNILEMWRKDPYMCRHSPSELVFGIEPTLYMMLQIDCCLCDYMYWCLHRYTVFMWMVCNSHTKSQIQIKAFNISLLIDPCTWRASFNWPWKNNKLSFGLKLVCGFLHKMRNFYLFWLDWEFIQDFTTLLMFLWLLY